MFNPSRIDLGGIPPLFLVGRLQRSRNPERVQPGTGPDIELSVLSGRVPQFF